MSSTVSVTTGLMAAFALVVVYARLKNWVDSNIPIFFYVAMIIYMRAVDGSVPLWLLLAGLACTLTLRFEFMNNFFIRVLKVIELAVLAGIIYLCVIMITQG